MQFIQFEKLKEDPVSYLLFLAIIAIVTLFFIRENDIKSERELHKTETVELKAKVVVLDDRVEKLVKALNDCTSKNQIITLLDSLNKKTK